MPSLKRINFHCFHSNYKAKIKIIWNSTYEKQKSETNGSWNQYHNQMDHEMPKGMGQNDILGFSSVPIDLLF